MGIMIILRSLNRAIFKKKLPLFYVTEVERGYDDAVGEYYNVKSKIYNNENFKWEEHDSILPLSEISPYMDDLSAFFETWVEVLYDKLLTNMWASSLEKQKG